MYPVENVYSLKAHDAWRKHGSGNSDLKSFRENWDDIAAGAFWNVSNWDELRSAVSFLTLMNKRQVLYFRGQTSHFSRCLPALFRDEWQLEGNRFSLTAANRGRYYHFLPTLGELVVKAASKVGTPRRHILESVPGAAAAVLQHYLLWPTHFTDITRSLPTAIAFATSQREQREACLYVFAMPDLRGSVTSDMDQHLTLSRLEAVCPPSAKRPHHQDAYLVARFPEPVGLCQPGQPAWDDWQNKSDLMRRIVAKFRLNLDRGALPGCPRVDLDFLIPPLESDEFGTVLRQMILPVVETEARKYAN